MDIFSITYTLHIEWGKVLISIVTGIALFCAWKINVGLLNKSLNLTNALVTIGERGSPFQSHEKAMNIITTIYSRGGGSHRDHMICPPGGNYLNHYYYNKLKEF